MGPDMKVMPARKSQANTFFSDRSHMKTKCFLFSFSNIYVKSHERCTTRVESLISGLCRFSYKQESSFSNFYAGMDLCRPKLHVIWGLM